MSIEGHRMLALGATVRISGLFCGSGLGAVLWVLGSAAGAGELGIVVVKLLMVPREVPV
jgi:hypothetical protein